MTPANPAPSRSFPTHKEIPEEYYKEPVRHVWSKARHDMVTCKTCGMEINKNDKIYNLYCPDERLKIIDRLKEIDYILNHQPTQKEPWSNFDTKYIVFNRKDWNKMIRSIRVQLRRQE